MQGRGRAGGQPMTMMTTARFVSCVRPRLCFTPSLALGKRLRLEKGLDRPANEWPLFSVPLQVLNTPFLLPNNMHGREIEGNEEGVIRILSDGAGNVHPRDI